MKKIMFNDKYGLTEAVLNGTKTQTRRVINLKECESVKVVALDNGCFMSYVAKEGNPTAYVGALEMPNFVRPLEPKYFIGEVVAVAQAYNSFYNDECDPRLFNGAGFTNKMFVKAELMPHHIRITNIRIERLQDISEEDCMAEGIYEVKGGFDETNYAYKGIGNSMFGTARCAYMSLIDKVCNRYLWRENPYVFVYDFELVD